MISIPDWVKTALDNNSYQRINIAINLKNGESLGVYNDDIVLGSFSVDRYSMSSSTLMFGSAIAAEVNFALDNRDGKYNDVNFAGAQVDASVYVKDDTHNWYGIRLGRFYVNDNPRHLSTISITALDAMTVLDAPIDKSRFTMPESIHDVMEDCCANVPIVKELFDTTFYNAPNHDGWIAELPNTSGILTRRQLLSWCAALLGACLYCDQIGTLRLFWYDVGSTNGSTWTADYQSTESTRYNSDIYDDDITITGMFYKDEYVGEYLYGNGDYVIDLSGNMLVPQFRLTQHDTDLRITYVLTNLYNALSPFTYCMYSATVKPAPYLWPGDSIDFYKVIPGDDSDPNNVIANTEIHRLSTITNVHYMLNGASSIGASGETAEQHQVAPESSPGTGTGVIHAISGSVDNDFSVGGTTTTTDLNVTGNANISGTLTIPLYNFIKVVSVSSSETMSTSYPTVTKTMAVNPGTGWSVIGIVGARASNSYCAIYRARAENGSAVVSIRYNGTGTSGTSVTIYADALCVKTS